VEITLDYQAGNGLGAFTGRLLDDTGTECASAILSVFEPDDLQALAGPQQDDPS
jgi:hypothetical protein